MKKIKKSLLLLLGLVLGVTFQSCGDKDGYSIGDFAVDWATVHAKGIYNYSFTGDDWGTMWPSASSVIYSPIDNQRVSVLFNPLYKNYEGYDYAIKVEGIHPILTKEVEELTPDNDKEYGNDPVNILKSDMWVGGGYLNVIFKQNRPAYKKHRVSLVKNAAEPLIDDEGFLHVEYRYNTYNDVTGDWGWGTVSFSLKNLNITPEVKGIKVKINSAVSGEKEVVFSFKEKNSKAPASASSLDYAEMQIE
ncbi:MAG: NigD-like protein [Phocaeicola sp.]